MGNMISQSQYKKAVQNNIPHHDTLKRIEIGFIAEYGNLAWIQRVFKLVIRSFHTKKHETKFHKIIT